MAKLSMIWAMARNRVIGNGLELPWHLPNDLRFFKKMTQGKTVIMGYKTFLSIGRPLPNRRNIILSYESIALEGVQVAFSIEESLKLLQNKEEAFVIGGSSIYKQFLPYVNDLYMTFIDEDIKGDIYFPEFDMNNWKLTEVQEGIVNDKNRLKHEFRHYRRI